MEHLHCIPQVHHEFYKIFKVILAKTIKKTIKTAIVIDRLIRFSYLSILW